MSTTFLEVISERDHPEMAIKEEIKVWVTGEIGKAIDAAKESFKPHGWEKVSNWLREWGIAGIVATIPIMLLGIALAAVYVAVGEVKQNAEFRGRTDQRLIRIESFMALSQASQYPKKVLAEIESLEQKVFPQFLPALRKVTEQPVVEVHPTQLTLLVIAGKLRQTDESSPDYWPTVLRFIQFASSGIAQNAPPPGQQPLILSNVSVSGFGRGIVAKGRTILLDGGYIENGEFTNCRIIFTQNPVRMKNTMFRNCAFELPATDTPSPYLKEAGHALLASNLVSVVMNISS